MAKPKTADFKAQAQMFKALAHPGRLLMLDELSRGERCVCELAALVGVRDADDFAALVATQARRNRG